VPRRIEYQCNERGGVVCYILLADGLIVCTSRLNNCQGVMIGKRSWQNKLIGVPTNQAEGNLVKKRGKKDRARSIHQSYGEGPRSSGGKKKKTQR